MTAISRKPEDDVPTVEVIRIKTQPGLIISLSSSIIRLLLLFVQRSLAHCQATRALGDQLRCHSCHQKCSYFCDVCSIASYYQMLAQKPSSVIQILSHTSKNTSNRCPFQQMVTRFCYRTMMWQFSCRRWCVICTFTVCN